VRATARDTVYPQDAAAAKGVRVLFIWNLAYRSLALPLALVCILTAAPASNAVQEHTPASDKAKRKPRPAEAVEAVLEAFDRSQLVALGEAHSLQEEHDFILSLLRHPDFALKVNDIVVEFGNARYQGLLARYIAGEAVDPAEMRRVWRDTTVSPLQQWDSPVYENFFAAVRELNRQLPVGLRLRVLAADPPIDWGAVGTREEVMRWRVQRDPHYASVVRSAVLARGRKALLLAGTIHFTRRSPRFPGAPAESANALQLIEQSHPGSTFVIAPHIGFGDRNCDLETRLADWAKPSLAPVRATWLGALDPRTVFRDTFVIGPPGDPEQANPWEGLVLGDLVDAYLYLGNHDELTLAAPSPFIYRDDAYFRELNRRSLIATGRPLPAGPQYYVYGLPARNPEPLPPPPGPAPSPSD
jgi:hypothetical protein